MSEVVGGINELHVWVDGNEKQMISFILCKPS